MKQVIKLEAIGHMRRDGSHDLLRMAKRFGFLDALPRFDRPWVARITGICPAHGFKREFIEGSTDYSEANSVGSRGVHVYFPVDEGSVYEVFELTSWRGRERYFVYPQMGRLHRLTRDEVVAWLAA